MSVDSTPIAGTKTLLVLGPLPPPIGGATRNIQVFLKEVARYPNVETIVINTSPSDYRKETSLWRVGTVWRAWYVLNQFRRCGRRVDIVLLWGRAKFIFSLGLLLLGMNRFMRKPFFIRPFGGDLDVMLLQLPGVLGAQVRRALQSATGILVQTEQLEAALMQMGLQNLTYIPGFRPPLATRPSVPPAGEAGKLALVFMGQLKAEKGLFVLLRALRELAVSSETLVSCDFYGPLFTEDEADFRTQLAATPGATYRGIVQPEAAPNVIAQYDCLVLPTYFINEGHPGVILEAMQASVPVISTKHRAIGELITSGENGYLVPPHDVMALAEAIKRIAVDPSRRQGMGRANYQRHEKFLSTKVVPQMLDTIFSASYPEKVSRRQRG